MAPEFHRDARSQRPGVARDSFPNVVCLKFDLFRLLVERMAGVCGFQNFGDGFNEEPWVTCSAQGHLETITGNSNCLRVEKTAKQKSQGGLDLTPVHLQRWWENGGG